MAKEELGKLSPEQLKKLGRVISEAKDLTSQQAEIIEKVLAGEEDIGKLRISYLEEYFDIYSRELDRIARKHSALSDAFLVLDNKLNENYRAMASDVAKLEKQLKDLAKPSENTKGTNDTKKPEKSTKKASDNTKDTSADGKGSIQDILRALNSGVKLDRTQFKELLTKTRSALSNVKLDKTQYQTLLAKLSGTLVETTEAEAKEAKEPSPVAPVQYSENKSSVQIPSTDKDRDANLNVYKLFQELFDRSIPTAQTTANYESDHTSDLVAATNESRPTTQSNAPPTNINVEIAATPGDKPVSAAPASDDGQPSMPPQVPPAVPEPPASVKVENTASETDVAALKETEKTAKDFLKFLDGIAKDGIKASTQKAKVEARQLEHNKKLVESWAEKEKAIRTSMLELAIAKLQTQEELENRSIEIRLSRLKEATDAELAAQQLLNQIDLQLAPDTSKGAAKDLEIGDTRARKTNADINIKAYQELENQIADYRAKLDLETRLKTGKDLTAAEAAENEKLVRQYFAARKDAIIKEARDELLAKQQLAQLSKTNPKVAQEYEKKLAEYKAKLDFESIKANNGILTEEAAKANAQLAREDFANRREELLKEIALKQQLEADLAEIAKTDPTVAQEFERKMAEERAKLDYESRKANNGLLTQEAADANAKRIQEEFAAEKENIIKAIALKQQLGVEKPGLAQAREKQLAEYRVEQEARLRIKLGRDLTKEELQNVEDLAEAKFSLEAENLERIEKLREKEIKQEKKDRAKAGDKAVNDEVTGSLDKEHNLIDRIGNLIDIAVDAGDGDVGKTIGASLVVATKAISTLVQQLEETIDKVGSYKGEIDTRLQGSSNKKRMGSYWDQLTTDMMSVGAVTPYFKQEDFANNIKELVNKGISFDLKQRAFLMTIQEKIANTFNVADGTLLRLIRIQQEDSTAGRLGMESALNSFLNNMYETSEYLTDVAASVRGSLEEMQALMNGAEATEVEFQVQKWMGSLYSVGMSQDAVTAISNALGQVASGQVDALTNGGAGNLLVMAANNAGLPISDILTDGLNAKNTNKLLQATVDYLAEIAAASKDNNIVQQQLADVFGVKASDLRAATNLVSKGTDDAIYGKYLTYDNMLKQLNNMANSMIMRTSVGEFMTNVWENAQYSIASSMANNPITYLTYKLAGLLDDAVGGIDLPFINVMGFGVDLNTTVSDLMRLAAVGGGILGSLGPMISGLASSFSGQAMLSKMGISKGSGLTVTPRGNGDGIGSDGNQSGGNTSLSSSGYAGNSDGNDVKEATIQESEDSKKKQMVEAKEEEPANKVDVLNTTVLKIYELLDSVAKGSKTLRVRVDSYGLTGTGNNNSNTALGSNISNGLLGGSTGSAGGNIGGNSSGSGTGSFGSTGGYGSSGGGFGSSGGSGSGYGSSNYGSGSYGSSNSGTGGSGDGYGSSGSGVGGGSIDLGGWNMV